MVSALHHFLEKSIALDEALGTRETVPNAQALRREVSAKWFGDGRLLTMKDLVNMAAFGTYQASLAEVSNAPRVQRVHVELDDDPRLGPLTVPSRRPKN